MPLTVILRRLFLITLLVLPQVYWLGHAWRFAGRAQIGKAGRLAVRALISAAVIAMAAVLYDRIAGKFLPDALSSSIAPVAQLWIFSSTFAFFLTKALHAVAWGCQRMARWFRQPDVQSAHDPTRRTALYQVASIAGATPFM